MLPVKTACFPKSAKLWSALIAITGKAFSLMTSFAPARCTPQVLSMTHTFVVLEAICLYTAAASCGSRLQSNVFNSKKTAFVVEHDLTTLDFVADHVHVMFGDPGAYGCVSTLYSTSDGINIYFNGYSPADNMKFRNEAYKLNDLCDNNIVDIFKNSVGYLNYDEKIIDFNNFHFTIKNENIPSNIKSCDVTLFVKGVKTGAKNLILN